MPARRRRRPLRRGHVPEDVMQAELAKLARRPSAAPQREVPVSLNEDLVAELPRCERCDYPQTGRHAHHPGGPWLCVTCFMGDVRKECS